MCGSLLFRPLHPLFQLHPCGFHTKPVDELCVKNIHNKKTNCTTNVVILSSSITICFEQ